MHETTYWAFRGEFAAIGSRPRVPIAWASESVLHQDGLIEGRLISPPSAFSAGLSDARGAAPERPACTLEVKNSDRALDALLVGAATTAAEYTSQSILGLRGKLYRGRIATDGTCTETAMTPTLVASGPVGIDRVAGTVTIQLAWSDRQILGRSKRLFPISKLREARFGDEQYWIGYGPVVDWMAATWGYTDWERLWGVIRGAMQESLDETLPWMYGRPAIPLVRVSAEGAYPAYFMGACHSLKPGDDRQPLLRTVGRLDTVRELSMWDATAPQPVAIVADVQMDDGSTKPLTVICAIQVRKPIERDKADQYWLVDAGNFPIAPADVLRQVIVDHSEIGDAGLDSVSWDRAIAEQQLRVPNAACGLLRESVPLSEILAQIAPIGGMDIYVAPDDLLHVSQEGLSDAQRAEARGALPLLVEGDVYPHDTDGTPGWVETIPLDPESRGAVVSAVTVEWNEDQQELYPIQCRALSSVGMHAVELPIDSERQIDAGWLDPRYAFRPLLAMADAGAFPARRIDAVAHPDFGALPTGQMLRATNPFGLDARGAYSGRLVRLERAQQQPGDEAARLTLEDLGPAEAMRAGRLDSLANWVAYDSRGTGLGLILYQSTSRIAVTGVFTAAMVGATIWVTGAADPAANGGYRIVSLFNASQVVVTPTPPASLTVPASPGGTPLIDSAWIIVHSNASKGSAFRPDYIRAGDGSTGELSDGAAAFVFT